MTMDDQIIEANRNLRALLKGVQELRQTNGPNLILSMMLSSMTDAELRDLILLMAGQFTQIITEWMMPRNEMTFDEVVDAVTAEGFKEER